MKNLTKSTAVKYVAGFVGVAMALSFAIAPMIAGATTASDLQATINSLMAQIQAAQAQLSALNGGTTTTTTTSTGYTFNTNLTVGSTGVDVMNLQKVLNMSADTQVATTGAGSPGNESSYFGGLTKAAVMKFQTKYGISPVAGYVGALTRAKLNTMSGSVVTGGTTTTTTYPAGCTSANGYSSTTGQACSSTTTTTTLPTGGNLTVMAGVQPQNSLAPAGASRVPFTTITLTAGSADVTVNSITVQRSGLAQDAVFAGVVILDQNGLQIGIAKTLNSNHQAVVGDPFVIPAGTSKTITIAGNMATSLTNYAGQVAQLDVVAVNTSATVAGSLPITGAQQTINASLTLGTLTVSSSSFDPNTAATEPIGTTGYRFSGVRLTAGSAEDVTFKSIRWNQTGSVGATDLANMVTVVNGTSYPTVVDSSGKYFTTVFPAGVVITKGNSVDVYLQGDIVGSGAAGRVAEFDIYKNTDVYLTGNTYGYGIVMSGSFGSYDTADATHGSAALSTASPYFQGSTLSIKAGSVTLISKAPEVASQNIAINVPNQVLGGYATNFSGEPVSVQSQIFTIATSSAPLGGVITSVTLVDQNGAVVAGPVDAVISNATTGTETVTFTDTVTYPVGRAVYTLKGKIPTGATNGATIVVYTDPSGSAGTYPTSMWSSITGQTTGNNIVLTGAGEFPMNTMTVKGANLAVNISSQPATQSVVKGVQNYVLANYQLDATQSGEDIRLSSFPVTVVENSPSVVGDLTGCALYNGTTQLDTGSNVKNTLSASNVKTNISFDQSLTIPKGTEVTLSLECNISSNAGLGSYQAVFDAAPSSDFSVTGVTSGSTVVPVVSQYSGGIMSVASGSFTVAADTSTPNYVTVAGGSTGVTLGVYKFHASNESINLNKVGLVMTSGSSADVANVYVYQGSTLLGTAIMPQNGGSGAVATSTFNTPLLLPANTDVLLTVKADMAAIGSSLSGTEGKLVQIDVTNAEGSGLSSGLTLKAGSVVAGTAGVRTFKSFPTVAQDTSSLSSSGVADGHLLRFKITANPSGNVGIYQMTFKVATSGATVGTNTLVTLAKLNVFTDSGYSQAAGGNFGTSTGQFGETNGSSYATGLISTPTITFKPLTGENPLEIPAGSTYYFSLDAQVGGVTTGSSVTTTLLGDGAYPTVSGGYYVDAATDGNISSKDLIWSGNATTTAAKGDNDWADGYGILNLPAGGFTQTRSN